MSSVVKCVCLSNIASGWSMGQTQCVLHIQGNGAYTNTNIRMYKYTLNTFMHVAQVERINF